jgi:uncharacterized protein (DUF433 family)
MTAKAEPRRSRDLRELASYGVRETAHALALPASTVRAWSVGAEGMKALIRPARRAPLALSFWNVVELFVLASMRRHHGISMPRVRRALDFVERDLHVAKPLLAAQFLTEGVDLFVDHYGRLINVSASGQLALREVITGALHRIERDVDGSALGIFPWLDRVDEPRLVELNVHRAFGRLVVAGTSLPVEALAERWRAGDTIDHLAEEYRLDRQTIEASLRWERRGLAA